MSRSPPSRAGTRIEADDRSAKESQVKQVRGVLTSHGLADEPEAEESAAEEASEEAADPKATEEKDGG
jgi:hypothetical protein